MRIDEPPITPQSPSGSLASGSSNASKFWTWALALMVPATCLALATVSAWLVPPYLGLLGWLVFAPALGRHKAQGTAQAHAESRADFSSDSGRSDSPDREVAVESTGVPDNLAADGTVATKPKRGRGRPKARAMKATEPAPRPIVSWVQVEPGKFVRVEGEATLDAGPSEATEAEGSRDAATGPPADLTDLPAVADVESGSMGENGVDRARGSLVG